MKPIKAWAFVMKDEYIPSSYRDNTLFIFKSRKLANALVNKNVAKVVRVEIREVTRAKNNR